MAPGQDAGVLAPAAHFFFILRVQLFFWNGLDIILDDLLGFSMGFMD